MMDVFVFRYLILDIESLTKKPSMGNLFASDCYIVPAKAGRRFTFPFTPIRLTQTENPAICNRFNHTCLQPQKCQVRIALAEITFLMKI